MKNDKTFKKELLIILVFVIAILVLLMPIILNKYLFSWSSEKVHGSLGNWMDFIATYYGAIVGGVISGSLTLIGVKLTIKSTIDSRKDELTIQTARERLFNFYHPVDNAINVLNHKYGAHNFSNLSFEEQNNLMILLSENLVYADSKLYLLIIEMQWMFKENDYKELNERYIEVGIEVTDHLHDLREQLKLPKIDIDPLL